MSTMTTSSTSSASTTATTATATISCSASGRGSVLTLSGLVPFVWTQYRLNVTASQTSMTLSFGFQTENNRLYYFDEVSLIDWVNSSVELLINPSFENSSSIPFGWTQSCSSTCSGMFGFVVSGMQCRLASGNCFRDQCYASSGIEFLTQTIATTIGNTYSISFYVITGGSGIATANRFLVDFF